MEHVRRHQTAATVTCGLVALAALAFCPLTSQAQSGFEAGLRLGYGVPLGEITDGGGDLNEGISGQIPLWLDLGYRIDEQWFIGLYGHYGFGFVGDQIGDICDAAGDLADLSCHASDIRFGFQAHVHISPNKTVDPWIGLGIGYEWFTFGIDAPNAEASITTSGFELLNLQAGLDLEASAHFVAGPFISFSLGQFDNVSTDCSGAGADCTVLGNIDIDNTTLHQWLVFGVRGAYKP